MSQRPDDERDPALENAWRAHSHETPPPALDRAILAAAHRAVGSGPEATGAAGAARRPQRWWMPLAAAAAIGVVAVGVLQLSPQDESLVVPNERVTSSAAPNDAARSTSPAPQAKQDAAADTGTPGAPAAPAAAQRNDAASADKMRERAHENARAPTPPSASMTIPTPAQSPASMAATPAPEPQAFPRSAGGATAAGQIGAERAPRAELPSATDQATDAAARVRQNAATRVAPTAPATVSSAEVARTPASPPAPADPRVAAVAPSAVIPAPAPARSPAPAAAPATQASATSMRDSPVPSAKREAVPEPFPAASGSNVAGALTAPPLEQRTDAARRVQSNVSPESDARTGERKDLQAPRQGFVPPAPAPSAALSAAKPQAPAAAGGAASFAANAGASRARENAPAGAAARDEVRESSAAAAPAPLAKSQADAKARARDPDAWLVRIRKLRDEGNTAEAVRELREFREYVPDADRRIPSDLRELANLGAR